MRTLIAMLAGAIIAVGAVVVLVHNGTMTGEAPARVLYDDGSG